MSITLTNIVSSRLAELVRKLSNDRYRDSYLATRLKHFLANQIRVLRGDDSQAAFGRRIDKPQSVVSRLEDPDYGNVSVQTLLDIAAKLKLALIIQFVDWPTFLRFTEDASTQNVKPEAFDQEKVDALVVPQPITLGNLLPTPNVSTGILVDGITYFNWLTPKAGPQYLNYPPVVRWFDWQTEETPSSIEETGSPAGVYAGQIEISFRPKIIPIPDHPTIQ